MTRRIEFDKISVFLHKKPGANVVDMSGDLSYADHHKVRETLRDIFKETFPDVVLNLASLNHVDSAGLGVLVGLRLFQSRDDGQIRLTGVPRSVRKLLKDCRLEKLFSIEQEAAG